MGLGHVAESLANRRLGRTGLRSFCQSKEQQRQFDVGGSDHSRMLHRWKKGEIDSWAIRWCYAQHKAGGLTVYPTVSKVQNIGFTADATNTHVFNRYQTVLDTENKTAFSFCTDLVATPFYLKQLRNKFSIKTRLMNRLRTVLQQFTT